MSPEPQRGWTGSRRRFASSSTSTAGSSEVRKGATSDGSSGECTRDAGTNISGTPCRWRASCVPEDHAFITSALSLARRRRLRYQPSVCAATASGALLVDDEEGCPTQCAGEFLSRRASGRPPLATAAASELLSNILGDN